MSVFQSSAVRLALGYAVLFVASSLVLLAFVYWSFAGFVLRQSEQTTEAEIEGLAERYRSSGIVGVTTLIDQRLGRQPSGASIYLLVDPLGRPLVGNLSGWPAKDADAEGWLDFRLTGPADEEVHWARAKTFRLQGGYRLLVGRDMFELQQLRSTLLRTVLWGVVLTAALALAGGFLISRGRLRRVGVVNEALAAVIEGDLGQRIPRERSDDDIERLVDTLNHTLGELERSFEGVRQVSDNIAHDLRTPLARLRNRLERLSQEASLGASHREELERSVADADSLLATFSALLRIAHIESAHRRSGFEEVDLARVTADVIELYEPIFEQAQRPLEVSLAEGRVRGDRNLLSQAAANLLDNALRHAKGPGGESPVEVTVSAGASDIQLAVADRGPGIPDDQRERVKQRFYRLDSSRTTPGSGLGLSLVEAVAELHHGQLELRDNEPGLRAILKLPKA